MQAKFGGDTPYLVMFGPDVCGSTQRTHVILNYPAAQSEDKNLLIKRDVPTRTDQLSHLYTLHLMANNSFNVLIDGESVRFGNLEEEWDFLPPKKIKDPAVSKPEDWVDEEMVRACLLAVVGWHFWSIGWMASALIRLFNRQTNPLLASMLYADGRPGGQEARGLGRHPRPDRRPRGQEARGLGACYMHCRWE